VNREIFLNSFAHIADTPGGMEILRALILDLAVGGRLTSQRTDDQSVADLLKRLSDERARMVEAKKIRRSRALPGIPTADRPHLPNGWDCVRFGELFSRMGAGSTPAGGEKSYVKDGILFLRSQNVFNSGLVLDGAARIPEATHEKMSATKVMGGDILLNITGASIGRVAVVPRDGWITANVNQHVSVLRPLLPEVTEYLHLMMTSPYFQRLIARSSPGASREGLAIKRMELFPVPLPPVAEQHRIAERVNELMGMCDELEAQQAAKAEMRMAMTGAAIHRISHADSAPELREALAAFAASIEIHLAPGDGDVLVLKPMRQAILDLATRGRLTCQDPGEEPAVDLVNRISAERDRMIEAREIRKPKARAADLAAVQIFRAPAGWEWVSLGQLVLFSDSGWSPACLPSRRSEDSQWGVLKVSAVSWGEFRADEHKQLTPGLIPRPQIEVQDGDFLLSRANTVQLVGRSVVATDPPPRLMLSDKHVRLRFLDRPTAEYVNLVNGSSSAREYYAAVATGTSDSMRNITREQILALPVPVPPLAEQKRIVDVVRALHAHCDKLELQLLDAQSRRRGLSESMATHVTAGNF